MLKAEVAAERLKSFAVERGEERRLAAVRALPASLRSIGYAIMHRNESGQPMSDWSLVAQKMERLNALDPLVRQELFVALFPMLAHYVNLAWEQFANLPYQGSYSRRAFRAPHSPTLVRDRRWQFLSFLFPIAAAYEQEITWFAAWAPYLGYDAGGLGLLFAAAIDAGDNEGEEIFQILLASARGEHETGSMGQHVTRALLVAARPEGWEFIEKLLLAAQRQEGLRQTILETVDEAHPEAFARMLRLLLDHDLVRFSSVTRAVDVWTGFQLDALKPAAVHTVIKQLQTLLTNEDARAEALAGDNPQATYLALWAMAYQDVERAIAVAAPMLCAEQVETRFVAATLLREMDCPPARKALLLALEDTDLHVTAQAAEALRRGDNSLADTDCYERLERLLARLTAKEVTLEPLVWPWTTGLLFREAIASVLIQYLGTRPPQRLFPHLTTMESYGRMAVIRLLTGNGTLTNWDATTREALFKLATDAGIGTVGLKAIAACRPSAAETQQLERLLTRKTPEVRQATLAVLINQEEDGLAASVDRLLAAAKPEQRAAGLELVRQLQADRRSPQVCRAALERYAAAPRKKTDMEQRVLEDLLKPVQGDQPTRANGLGLFDPAQLTPAVRPTLPSDLTFVTAAAVNCLGSLRALMDQYRETPVTLETYNGKQEKLFGNIQHDFPVPQPGTRLADDMARLPLREVWATWERERPESLRDADGLELLRAAAAVNWLIDRPGWSGEAWFRSILDRLYWHEQVDQIGDKFTRPIRDILSWWLRLTPVSGAASYLLDRVAATFALMPQEELERPVDPKNYRDQDWRESYVLMSWLRLARLHRSFWPEAWTAPDHVRLWQLVRWRDRPIATASRYKPQLVEALVAHAAGAASEADLLDLLVGEPDSGARYRGDASDALKLVSTRKPHPLCVQYPILSELVARCRRRIVEIEIRRGDLPTPASVLAMDLRHTGGLETLLPALPACAADSFERSHWLSSDSRVAVFSHLVRCTFPAPNETPELFAQRIASISITPQRLVELAVYAPQWAGHIERTLGWSGLAEGVWWLHAHTKDAQWGVQQEIKDAWAAQVSERTPLSSHSLLEGAVDVAWFHRVHAALGTERWAILDEAAKYAASGTGHSRARLFADAMLGRQSETTLIQRVREKRNQDALRALGLLPLPGGAEREANVLARYQVAQEFLRGSRQFGSQRQASERLAASISLQNLARTAGFPDPQRLEWAMEAAAVADLAAGPVAVQVEDVTVTLTINVLGQPELSVRKGVKSLKSVPPAAKKEPDVAALQERYQEIERQAARMRRSLEQAMCRGDRFTARELQELLQHPVLKPMLRALIFSGDGAIGYPAEGGRALEGHDGSTIAIDPETFLRIAHPYDLLHTEEWTQWQRDCFLRERVQPFKQVFRELYVLTDAEQTEGHGTRRYEGHQVNPSQALALLGRCGWVNRPEEGVFRTFHEQGLTAWLTFDQGFTTPAEVEGPAVDGLWFTRKGEARPLPLAEVPPRLFSEVMRDLDLMVSVAHVGGVDPEASHSTVAMREALLREAARLLHLHNIRYQGQHVLIDGELGVYSVHLGSAVVHRQPGGHLCIVPVHSQQRGRLFLPFVDSDPKTAEVISKVLLLARDTEIKDPTLLEQILSPAYVS
jgi:hypothetical protein